MQRENNNIIKTFLPSETDKLKQLEQKIHSVMNLYNFKEIRPSLVIPSNFLDKILIETSKKENKGNLSDMVFFIGKDKCMRPDGTSVCLFEYNDKIGEEDLLRLYYIGPMFRKNYLRKNNHAQFIQYGAEIIGSSSSIMDVEVILLGIRIFENLGLKDIKVEINSYGCVKCLKMESDEQHDVSKKYYLDSGLCEACTEKLNFVKNCLSNLNRHFEINKSLERNYNYYNETVFNYYIQKNGEKIVLGGGGRYDTLFSKITMKKLPALGFSANLSVVYDLITNNNNYVNSAYLFSVYVFTTSQELEVTLLQLVQELHDSNICCIMGNSNYSQEECVEKHLKIAKKNNCSLVIQITEDNLSLGKVLIFNLVKQHEESVYMYRVIEHINRLKKALKQTI